MAKMTIRGLEDISIHAPRVGSDINNFHVRCGTNAFQSTLPVWGATRQWENEHEAEQYDFNPRSPCGERLLCAKDKIILMYFNPRSPCGERPAANVALTYNGKFQSTLPVWGATLRMVLRLPHILISIHAPRVGSDALIVATKSRDKYFNPRSPCGERHRRYGAGRCRRHHFNPRSPCGERRLFRCSFRRLIQDFNPRSPCGERQ